jgi:hypothetical protein
MIILVHPEPERIAELREYTLRLALELGEAR